MIKYDFLYVLALAGFLTSCKAPSKMAATPGTGKSDVALLEDSLKGGHLGILVVEAESGKVLAEHNSHKYFVPASNTKLLSMYAGLKYLPDSLVGLRYYDAGDTIYAFPSGDPSLLSADFETHPVYNWLSNVKKPVVMDGSKWRAERYGLGWTWGDYQASYQQERSALPVNGNMMPLRFTAKGNSSFYEGQKQWTVKPSLQMGVLTDKKIWKLNAESVAYIYTPGARYNRINRAYAANAYEVSYNGRDTVIRTEIPYVTYGIKTGVEILRAQLNKTERDVIISNNASARFEISAALSLAKENLKYQIIHSQPLDSLLRPMMHRSDNFYAEQTLLMASNEFLGYMSDRNMIDTLMKTEFKGMPDKPVWVDGSGLSRYNLLSPADFVWLLDKLRKEFSIERIKAILPTGNAGTLTNYYTSLNGKIFAKTGSLSGQLALSGYLYAKSGKLLLFSALVNNHNMEAPKVRRQIEKYLLGVWEGN
jgi:D-alanyl-D-alanine carboxypeptidase/D-alanyl-D-alanine-endopeptidase (penicillin-binding protein 4)